jgi:hypothetical protein
VKRNVKQLAITILDLKTTSNTITGMICSDDPPSLQRRLVLEAVEFLPSTEEHTISWA